MHRTFKNGLCTLGIGSLLLATTALDVTAADPEILQYRGYNPETIAAIYQGNWAVSAAFRKCGELGAHLYGTRKSRMSARDDTVAFFARTLSR